MRVKTCCPHDCYDTCGIEVEVHDGKVTDLRGADSHGITRGFLCGKVSRYLKRQYSPDRLLYPLKRDDAGFKRISWEEALDTIALRFGAAREKGGPTTVLSYSDAGSMGYLKSLESRFWHYFGGVTIASGSLCSAAGLAAVASDYGEIRQHDPQDIPNSKLIILWGRNPSVTNIHMIPLLAKARQNGCRIISINPMPSESKALSDWQLKPRPGTDAALALGIAAQIFKEGLEDAGFLSGHCAGLMAYKREVSSWNLDRTESVTGVAANDIVKLAREYAGTKPASIWLGFGMQRHAGGGNAVRAVNALGAVTGNIGIAGGGVNYANRSSRVLNALGRLEPGDSIRNVWKGRLAEDLDNMGEPAIEAAFINRCNPLLQAPDTSRLERAFQRIPFKVVSDHFLTDTALQADIVLPAATFLEETDIYYSYFHNYISLGMKAVEPSGEAKSDLWVLGELAKRLGFGKEFERTPIEWIEYALEPMKAHGIDLDLLLEQGWVRFPAPLVPWTDHVFKTATGKLNLGLPEAPAYIEPFEMPHPDRPFFLLTGALRDRLHSQYDNMEDADKGELPKVYMNPKAANRLQLSEGQAVEVFTMHGEMTFELGFDQEMREDVMYAHHGRWKNRGGGINRLTKGYLADMGGQGALYDCAAGIRPAEVR